jgi:hypothetical protein
MSHKQRPAATTATQKFRLVLEPTGPVSPEAGPDLQARVQTGIPLGTSPPKGKFRKAEFPPDAIEQALERIRELASRNPQREAELRQNPLRPDEVTERIAEIAGDLAENIRVLFDLGFSISVKLRATGPSVCESPVVALEPEEKSAPGNEIDLGQTQPRKDSDSDVRLESRPGVGARVGPDEEIALDWSGPGRAVSKGGSSAKLSALPGAGNKAAKPPADGSEFELSLDADSDDFELQLNPDSGDEVDLGQIPKAKGQRIGGKSGINLRNPADSGISLEKPRGTVTKPTDRSEFELVLDDANDFELRLITDDKIDLGQTSGVNQSSPADSGIPLEKKARKK